MGEGQVPLDWWLALEETADAEILAFIFCRPHCMQEAHLNSRPLHSISILLPPPNSVADEPTTSAATMINTVQRSWQKVEMIMAMTQVRRYKKTGKIHTIHVGREDVQYCAAKSVESRDDRGYDTGQTLLLKPEDRQDTYYNFIWSSPTSTTSRKSARVLDLGLY